MSGEEKPLHSRNPVQEAERYVRALALDGNPRCLALIEPGEGYLIPPLRRRLPGAKIIALHAEKQAGCPGQEPDAEWDPSRPESLRSFLEREIAETEAGAVKVIEWRPGLARYGGKYLALLSETAAFLKFLDANGRTVKHFGRRWFRNFLRNAALIRRVYVPAPQEMSVVVAAAGPSLQARAPLLREKRDGVFLLAVSSAVPALAAAGLAPDMVITSDGGGWALLHLYEYFRPAGAASFPPLAASLFAALPSQCAAVPVLPLSDGSLWQSLVLRGLGVPFLPLPQRGTVAAAALDLALFLTAGEVYAAGLDLAPDGPRCHAAPYAFDRLEENAACRLAPRCSLAFIRARAAAEGGSLAVYAGWFAAQLPAWPRRVHFLEGSHPVFASRVVKDIAAAPGPARPAGTTVSPAAATASQAAALLAGALKNPALAGQLTAELRPLLFPGGAPAGPEDLAGEIAAMV
ncbi:MAG: DUF115 domain-containing protein [Treponematales bacterium]